MVRLVLEKLIEILEFHLAFSTELETVYGRFVIDELTVVTEGACAVDSVALILAHNVSLEVIA